MNSYDLIMLLTPETKPSDIQEISNLKIDKMSRTSRTQNQWLIKVKSNQSLEVIKASLESVKSIQSIEVQTSEIEAPKNSSNTKKGKSNPNKNPKQ